MFVVFLTIPALHAGPLFGTNITDSESKARYVITHWLDCALALWQHLLIVIELSELSRMREGKSNKTDDLTLRIANSNLNLLVCCLQKGTTSGVRQLVDLGPVRVTIQGPAQSGPVTGSGSGTALVRNPRAGPSLRFEAPDQGWLYRTVTNTGYPVTRTSVS